MKRVGINVQGDFLRNLARVAPLRAIEELIWNSLDADADRVSVAIVENQLGGVAEIQIDDDGHGIAYDEAEHVFGFLGGSRKRTQTGTRVQRRPLHGREGRGRFRAFRLGDHVSWNTCFELPDGQRREYVVVGEVGETGSFMIGDPVETVRAPGTSVFIRAVVEDLRGLRGSAAVAELATRLAPYLFRHPGVRVSYAGVVVDPGAAQLNRSAHPLEAPGDQGPISATLEIVEWRMPVDRKIVLCGEDGIVVHEFPSVIHAPGFDFTAYLRAPAPLLAARELVELDPDVVSIVDAARSALRTHFKQRSAQRGGELIDEWLAEGVYPYSGPAAGPLEQIERDTFDVVAITIDEKLRTFETSDTAGRRFQLRLLREALTESPAALRTILEEVLSLSAADKEEFAELLGRASLGAIVKAGRLVAGRLDLLNGLQALVYDRDLKTVVKERGQLHEIVADEAWIFGEEFHLSHKEVGLTTLLRDCLVDRQDVLVDEAPSPKRRDRVDIVVTRSIAEGPKRRRNLVIELKRPSRKIDVEVKAQVERYAARVVMDPRYPHDRTEWDFIAVSSELDPSLEIFRNQLNRPPGLLDDLSGGRARIWARTWGEIIEGARSRHEFYRHQLELSATSDDAFAYLRRVHGERLPNQAMRPSR